MAKQRRNGYSKLLEQAIKRATEDGIPTPLVTHVKRVNGKPAKQVVVSARGGQVPSVQDNIIRIVRDADPIGFLMDVQNGHLFEEFYIDKDGKVHVLYSTPSLDDRIKAARYLADKVMPRLKFVAHRMENPNGGEGGGGGGAGGGGSTGVPSFAQLVEAAASRDDKKEE